MKSNLTLLSLLIFFGSFCFGQSKSWMLGSYHNIDIQSDQPQPLPISVLPGGYQGQPARNAQNIITDANNQIRFFIVDDFIYDRNGNLIEQMSGDYLGYPVNGWMGQTGVVPVPGNCEEYYIVSTGRFSDDPTSLSGSRVYIGRFRIVYNGDGTLNSCSGFEDYTNPDNGDQAPMRDLASIAGSEFYSNNAGNPQNEYHRFAITKELNGEHTLIVANHTEVHVFKLSNSSVNYLNTINLLNIDPSINTPYYHNRNEMEVFENVSVYRVGLIVVSNPGYGVFDGVFSFDINPVSGQYISNSERLGKYTYTSNLDSQVELKGLEFSSSGQFLYVTHNAISPYSSTLDRFDMSIANPVRQIIATSSEYEDSHLERITSDQIMIPTQTTMKAIQNSSGTPTFSNLFGLNSYQSVSPFAPQLSSNASYARLLQHQIDDFDYGAYLIADLECCLKSKIYDQIYFEATSSQTWNNNFNPLNNSTSLVVYIKEELRIRAGVTITMQGLTIHFAPGARLVIENGDQDTQGGRLILDNTTLTVDDRCDQGNLRWLGVEVWGNQNLEQGNYFSSIQGVLQMQNVSTIEHAYVGTLVGRRTSTNLNECPGLFDQEVDPFLFDDNYNGGIVRVFNSQYLQNQRGIWMRKYLPSSGNNNLSIVTNGHFEWNNPLNGGISVQSHIMLESIKGLVVKGSDFWNMPTAPYSYIGQGMGIYSRGSQFVVDLNCPVLTTSPCSNPDKTHFKNLEFGIHASNPTDNLTFSVENSEFENCVAGIYTFATRYERINKNTFASHEDQFTTVGVYLRNSTGYTVQENNFTGIPTGISPSIIRSHGMIVENSGTLNNLVYKNNFGGIVLPNPAGGTFTGRLWAGSLSLKSNGSTVPAAVNSIGGVYALTSGLKWKCNNFIKQIENADIMVNGVIDYNQGKLVVPLPITAEKLRNAAAGNSFSASGLGTPPEHDVMVDASSQPFRYVHLSNPSHLPDERTVGYVFPLQSAFFGQALSVTQKTCPSKLNKPIGVIITGTQDAFVQLNEQFQKIKDGSNLSLLNMINSTANYLTKKDALLNVSPFLADTILIAWINSGAPSGMIKDVLLANTRLSMNVLNAVSSSSLPIGTKNQIMNAQSGPDLKEETYNLIADLQNDYDEQFNESLSRLLLDTVTTTGYAEAISLLNSVNDSRSKKILVDIHLAQNELPQMNDVRSQLQAEELEEDYDPLQSIKEIMQPLESEIFAIDSIPFLASDLDYLSVNAGHPHIRSKSKAFLEFRDGPTPMPELPPFGSSSILIQQSVSEEPLNYESSFSVYPNPSSGIVWIDYPKQQEGILSVQLLDLNGKVISTYTSSAVTNGERLDFSEVKKGFYFLDIIMDDSRMETIKLHLH